MRNKWVLSCAILLATASAVFAQPQELTGREILASSVKAYAKLDKYVGTCSVISRSVVQKSEAQTMDKTTITTAKIEFNRSAEGRIARVGDFDKQSRDAQKPLGFSADAGKITIKGVGYSNTPFSLVGDDKTATVTVARGSDGKEHITNFSTDRALGSLVGISAFAATIVPKSLLGLGNTLTYLHSPQLQGVEKIGIWDCYKVTDFEPVWGTKSTFWIDQKTFLMRQYQTEISGDINPEASPVKDPKFHDELKEMQQKRKEDGTKYRMTLQMIGIEEAR